MLEGRCISAIRTPSQGPGWIIDFSVLESMSDEDREYVVRVFRYMNGDDVDIDEHSVEAAEIRRDRYMKEAIESLIFCEDADDDEICSLLGIDIEVLDAYIILFCNVDILKTFFKRRAFVESRISAITSKREISENDADTLTSLMFKRWALLLGKEFVVWKFGLRPVDVSTLGLVDVVEREALFYYKEISLSEHKMEKEKFFKIVSSVIKTAREIVMIKSRDASSESAVEDIREALGLDIIELEPIQEKDSAALPADVIINSKV